MLMPQPVDFRLSVAGVVSYVPRAATRDSHGKLVLDAFKIAAKWPTKRRRANGEPASAALNDCQGSAFRDYGSGTEPSFDVYDLRILLGHSHFSMMLWVQVYGE